MKQKTYFDFEKAIKVDEKMLIEIKSCIEEYCPQLRYEAELENNDEIEFESIDELLSFENSPSDRLKSLQVYGKSKDSERHIRVKIGAEKHFGGLFYRTAFVSLETDDPKMKTIIKESLLNVFERNKLGRVYNFISRMPIFFFMDILYLCVLVVFLYSIIINGMQVENGRLFVMVVIFSVVEVIKTKFEKWYKFFFESVVFYIGDGKEVYDRNASARSNFFWGVIVGVLIPFLISSVWNIIKTM